MNSTNGYELAIETGGRAWSRSREIWHRCTRPRSRKRAAAVMALLGVNAAVLWGVVQPRVGALEARAEAARSSASQTRGEAALLRMENERLRAVQEHSSEYRIPASLAASIYDIALSEGLSPDLGFRLVQTESSFRRYAVSEAGAVGYTQILPSTAAWLDPSVSARNLYDAETNLRLGFRYLNQLLHENGGDLRLALLAYNRGPTRVKRIVASGRDPANGYATQILGSE